MNFILRFDIHLNGLILFLHAVWWIEMFNSVSLKPRSLKSGGKWSEYRSSHCSNILKCFCHIRAILEAVAQKMWNICKKTTVLKSLFLAKLQVYWKRKPRHIALSQHFQKTALDIKFFFLNYFFTGIPGIIWSFSSNRTIFVVDVCFVNYEAKAQ